MGIDVEGNINGLRAGIGSDFSVAGGAVGPSAVLKTSASFVCDGGGGACAWTEARLQKVAATNTAASRRNAGDAAGVTRAEEQIVIMANGHGWTTTRCRPPRRLSVCFLLISGHDDDS